MPECNPNPDLKIHQEDNIGLYINSASWPVFGITHTCSFTQEENKGMSHPEQQSWIVFGPCLNFVLEGWHQSCQPALSIFSKISSCKESIPDVNCLTRGLAAHRLQTVNLWYGSAFSNVIKRTIRTEFEIRFCHLSCPSVRQHSSKNKNGLGNGLPGHQPCGEGFHHFLGASRHSGTLQQDYFMSDVHCLDSCWPLPTW